MRLECGVVKAVGIKVNGPSRFKHHTCWASFVVARPSGTTFSAGSSPDFVAVFSPKPKSTCMPSAADGSTAVLQPSMPQSVDATHNPGVQVSGIAVQPQQQHGWPQQPHTVLLGACCNCNVNCWEGVVTDMSMIAKSFLGMAMIITERTFFCRLAVSKLKLATAL